MHRPRRMMAGALRNRRTEKRAAQRATVATRTASSRLPSDSLIRNRLRSRANRRRASSRGVLKAGSKTMPTRAKRESSRASSSKRAARMAPVANPKGRGAHSSRAARLAAGLMAAPAHSSVPRAAVPRGKASRVAPSPVETAARRARSLVSSRVVPRTTGSQGARATVPRRGVTGRARGRASLARRRLSRRTAPTMARRWSGSWSTVARRRRASRQRPVESVKVAKRRKASRPAANRKTAPRETSLGIRGAASLPGLMPGRSRSPPKVRGSRWSRSR